MSWLPAAGSVETGLMAEGSLVGVCLLAVGWPGTGLPTAPSPRLPFAAPHRHGEAAPFIGRRGQRSRRHVEWEEEEEEEGKGRRG